MVDPRYDSRNPRRTRLSGIELGNFKSVRADEVAIRPLTVIAGANSSGKSTLIQAVLALAQVSRRRIDGRRFPLNDELARLGSFASLRHQGSGSGEPVRLGACLTSDEGDVRRNAPMRFRMVGPSFGSDRSPEPLPVDIRWAVELDSSVDEQIGSAQISALEASINGNGINFSTRLERTNETSEVRFHRDEIDDARRFVGTLRTGTSDTEVPVTQVLDAFISSAQAVAFFGTPPDPFTRVHEWFLGIQDQEDDGDEAAEMELERPRVIQQAAWAVREDVPAPPEFVFWYRGMDRSGQESVEAEVLAAFEADRQRLRARWGEIERLEGRAPAWLAGAQQASARYLATQVRYVGPLRQAPHQPFGTAPDPDAGDVGVAGQYVAAVLQANRSLRRRFPLPMDGQSRKHHKRVTLEEAVNRWLKFLGLATSLIVREDTPLVLGVDVVPPGLEQPVSLGSVGVGVSQVLPIIVQCLVAGPGALVVLEQPELHLHPAAQQRLADFLLACTNGGQNILVESHSEYLVLRLRRRIAEDYSDNLRSQVGILFAERDATGATTYKDVELTPTGGVVEWPQGFFDQGPDEAHQLLIAAADRQRAQGVTADADG